MTRTHQDLRRFTFGEPITDRILQRYPPPNRQAAHLAIFFISLAALGASVGQGAASTYPISTA